MTKASDDNTSGACFFASGENSERSPAGRFQDRNQKNFLTEETQRSRKHFAEKHIRSVSNRDQEPCLKIWTEINSLTGSAVLAS